MRKVNEGIFWLFVNATFYSLASLGFVKTGFDSALVSSWVGLIGFLFSVLLLSFDSKFSVANLRLEKQLYISLLNALIFGGISNGLHFISLRYILPSDAILINAFFCLCTSVVAEVIKERRLPTCLSLLSVLAGITGTGLICNPEALFTLDMLKLQSLFGVCLATGSGIFFVIMLSNLRNYELVSANWNYLGYISGTGLFGLVRYRPLSTLNTDCSMPFKIIAALCFLSQCFASFAVVKGILDIFRYCSFTRNFSLPKFKKV